MTVYHLLMLCPMLAMLVIASCIDARSRRIPNWLTLSLASAGVAQSFVPGSLVTPGQSLLGLLLGFGIPMVLFVMGALGGGDVKLLAAVGAWLGPALVFKVILAAAVVGLVIVLVQATAQGRLRTLFRNSTVLTVNMMNMDVVGMDAVTTTGQSCRSVDRPLPYAVPVAAAVLLILMIA